MAMTTGTLRQAIERILASLQTQAEHLTSLDGQIGDGDLGITLLKAFRELDRIKETLPEDLGAAFMQCAAAVSRVSSSSFGTLLATCLMTVAKQTKGHTSADWLEFAGYLDKSVDAMIVRGKAALGDKTVMDAVKAAATAAEGKSGPAELLAAVKAAVDQTMAAFRDKPNKVGRARIFAERTIGMDDPGMVAFKVMVDAI